MKIDGLNLENVDVIVVTGDATEAYRTARQLIVAGIEGAPRRIPIIVAPADVVLHTIANAEVRRLTAENEDLRRALRTEHNRRNGVSG